MARATILTGKYSHLNGFYNNTNSRFDGTQTTFPKLLQKAGYKNEKLIIETNSNYQWMRSTMLVVAE